MAKLPEIASLWIGDRLSWLEQLCLKSFADAGHETTLYSYTEISNLPDGVQGADAAEIFPGTPMYRHVRTGSPAIHADLWRLQLLKKTNKIWVDADVYCRLPFDFNSDFVFGWEKHPKLVCNAVLGLPKDSQTLNGLLDFLQDEYAIAPWLAEAQQQELQAQKDAGDPVHITAQKWGFTGPAAITYFLKETGEISHAKPQEAFYPISFKHRNHMILSRFSPEDDMTENTHGVHFWARRMKPRLQEKEGNVPRRGSYMHGLLKKHDIDPSAAPIPAKKSPPADQADIKQDKTRQNQLIDPEQLDVTMFDEPDLLNFILQRSEILFDIPRAGRMIRDWSNGSTGALDTVVAEKGRVLAQRAIATIGAEFEKLRPVLDTIPNKSVADIGCGYAVFDLYLARAYNSKLTLIDLEANDHRHFGFESEGAAYSDLDTAVRFLESNGVAAKSIQKMNPEKADIMSLEPVDLALSFLACGFHFPIDGYLDFFAQKVKPGGHILLDLRKKTFQEQCSKLDDLGEVTILDDAQKYARVLVKRAG